MHEDVTDSRLQRIFKNRIQCQVKRGNYCGPTDRIRFSQFAAVFAPFRGPRCPRCGGRPKRCDASHRDVASSPAERIQPRSKPDASETETGSPGESSRLR
eukprot:scaffold1378_cov257-Pinguiococcus_pyrenoidosus.AAC.13